MLYKMELDGSGLGMGPYTKGMVWEWDHTQRRWSGNEPYTKEMVWEWDHTQRGWSGMRPCIMKLGMVWNETTHDGTE